MFYYYHAEHGFAECRYAGCDFAECHGISVTVAIETVTNGDTLAYNRAKDDGFVTQLIPSLKHSIDRLLETIEGFY